MKGSIIPIFILTLFNARYAFSAAIAGNITKLYQASNVTALDVTSPLEEAICASCNSEVLKNVSNTNEEPDYPNFPIEISYPKEELRFRPSQLSMMDRQIAWDITAEAFKWMTEDWTPGAIHHPVPRRGFLLRSKGGYSLVVALPPGEVEPLFTFDIVKQSLFGLLEWFEEHQEDQIKRSLIGLWVEDYEFMVRRVRLYGYMKFINTPSRPAGVELPQTS